MIKVYWFANPYSPHVRHWFEMSRYIDGLEIEILHIHHKKQPCMPTVDMQCKTLVPKFLAWLPSVIQYIILGGMFRFKYKRSHQYLIHAHNTSGYGLAALVSSVRYIVTTYGTEIYRIKGRSGIYFSIIRLILAKSQLVTSTSPLMTQRLKELFFLDGKVHEFSLGVSRAFSYSKPKRREVRGFYSLDDSCTLLVVNRRVSPLYRTLDVVKCFLNVMGRSPDYKLIVLAGDSDAEYLREVENLVVQESSVAIVRGFLDQFELSAILSASDFFLSTPSSDQLSSSILEGIVCNSIPIISDLSAYELVKDVSLVVDNVKFVKSLMSVLQSVKSMSFKEKEFRLEAIQELKKELDVGAKSVFYKKALRDAA